MFKLNSNSRKIYNYHQYEHLSKVNLNISQEEIENIYVLLDDDFKEVLQYFWIKNKKSTHLIYLYKVIRHGFLATINYFLPNIFL